MTGDPVAYEQHDAYATSIFALNVERESGRPRQGVEVLFVVDSIARQMRRKSPRYISCATVHSLVCL